MEKLVAALAALFVLFYTQVTPERVEKQLEKAFRQSLAAESVKVDLDGAPGFPTMRGKFRKLTVFVKGLKFEGGQLLELLPVRFTDKPEKEGKVGEVFLHLRDAVYEGLSIAELNAHAKTVRFDLKGSLREKRLVLVSAAAGELTGFITADAARRYLTERALKEGIEDPQVRLRRGAVEIEGRWRVEMLGLPLVRVPFSAEAVLFPVANEVHWRLRRADIADLVPLPVGWLQERLKAFNPLLRLDLAPLQVNLSAIFVSPEGIRIAATCSLAPPNRP